MTAEADLRRQLTAAGVYGPSWSTPEPTDDEAEQLLVWLDAWQEQPRERHETATVPTCFFSAPPDICLSAMAGNHTSLAGSGKRGTEICLACDWRGADSLLPIARPLLDPPPGWELTRHVWCPRCERDGDPLRWRKLHWRIDAGLPFRSWLSRHRPRCAVFPPPPLLEIGPGCWNQLLRAADEHHAEARRRLSLVGLAHEAAAEAGLSSRSLSVQEVPRAASVALTFAAGTTQRQINDVCSWMANRLPIWLAMTTKLSASATLVCATRRVFRWGLRRTHFDEPTD